MIKIDVTEKFPRLKQAPIIEAVIEIRARAESPWEESAIEGKLKEKLPDYPKVTSQSEVQHELKIAPGLPPEQIFRDLGWKGLRLQSADDRYIAQFNRDAFVFSRLQPYERWDQFKDEAMRLWKVHEELANPTEVQRLGVRFINRISLLTGEVRLEDYLQVPPKSPGDLGFEIAGFFHHDNLRVPGYAYAINIIRTVQPPKGAGLDGGGLILDIDVFTTESFENWNETIEERLSEMRWLKNKVFYDSVTTRALEDLQ